MEIKSNEPVATAVYVSPTSMTNRLMRKDFWSEKAANAWLDAKVETGRVDLVEMRWYS